MVTTFRTSEAFAGALKLAGKATLVAFIDRCVGAVIRYMLNANQLSNTDSMKIYVTGNDERIMVHAIFDNLGKGA